MASRAITIELVGDASKLTGAFADAEKGSGSLGQKLEGLGGKLANFAAVGATAAVAGIGAAAAGLYKVGEQFDEAYDTIRTKTGATGAALEGLKGDFKAVFADVPTDAATAGKALAELAQRTGDTGKPLQDLTETVLELSRITKTDLDANVENAAKLFNRWAVETKDQSKTLDQFFRASQHSGVAVDKLIGQVQDATPALEEMGLGLDQGIALLAEIDQAGGDSEATIKGMTKAMVNFAKAGKDPVRGLQELVDQIKGTTDNTKALGLAAETFGAKNAVTMVEAIRSGKLEFGDMLDVVKNGTDTIRGAGKDTMDFAENWTLFKNNALLAIEPIAARVFGFLGEKTAGLADDVKRLSEAWQTGGFEGFANELDNILGANGKVGGTILWLRDTAVGTWSTLTSGTNDWRMAVENLTPALIALGSAVAAVKIGGLVTAITDATIAAGGLGDALVVLIGGPVGAVILALGLATAALVTFWQHNEGFRDSVKIMWSDIQYAFTVAVGNIQIIWETLLIGMERALQPLIRAWADVLYYFDKEGAASLRATADHFDVMMREANDHINGIQKKIDVAVEVHGFEQANARIDSFKDAVLSVPGVVATELQVNASRGAGPAIPGFASGGVAEGWAVVGEKGPELAYFGQPTQVFPSGTGPGGNVTINVQVNGLVTDPAGTGQQVADVLREYVRRGGSMPS